MNTINKLAICPILLIGIAAILITSCSKEEEALNYSVIYDGNANTGGNVPEDNSKHKQGEVVTVQSNTGKMVKAGFSFAHWNSSSNGTGVDYISDSTFIMGTSNITLFAKWVIGGKLTVTISDAPLFNDHCIYFMVFNSNFTAIEGQGMLCIANGTGSAVTLGSSTDATEKVFDNGSYYIVGFVDMNDNAESMDYEPDSGDRYSESIPIEINGDTEVAFNVNQFSNVIP